MKRTRKFIAAEKTAEKIGLSVDSDIYGNLEHHNYFWESDQGEWVKGEEPDAPISTIKIRVWADIEKVEVDARKIIDALTEQGFKLQEKSEVYMCRPPKQLEGRIYLTFSRQEKAE